MLGFKHGQPKALLSLIRSKTNDLAVQTDSLEEKVTILILRDLLRLGWDASFQRNKVVIRPPETYDKQVIRNSMEVKRQESISSHKIWIDKHIDLARRNLVDGCLAWHSSIDPVLEVCQNQVQLDLFRILRYYWSSPYSEYVGRRIKILIRDAAIPSHPVIGIAALGSSIIHIPRRDEWLGWSTDARTKNLVYTMDAYVLGAVPPYNYLLGGKLVSYLLASNEVRRIFKKKYKDQITTIAKRTASELTCIFTTSLYGKSSQYNRLKYNNELLYTPIGYTKGYGTLHLTNETFNAMRALLNARGMLVTNRFGDGPVWRMRVIRTAAELLNFDADVLLRHSFKRQIYAVPLASNFKEYLQGQDRVPKYCDYPMADLSAFWHARWLKQRKSHAEIQHSVCAFRPADFAIV
jgi:Domain of unknown function (DUF4338)